MLDGCEFGEGSEPEYFDILERYFLSLLVSALSGEKIVSPHFFKMDYQWSPIMTF